MLAVSAAAAGITCIFIPPDRQYLAYFETRTLVTLFAMLAVVCALASVDFFAAIAERVLHLFGSRRSVIIALVYLTLFGSMVITNDMALLAFLPLSYFVLRTTGHLDQLAFVFIMQTVAANLGGMITPFGSPQNLYLFSYFHIPVVDFLTVLLLPFVLSVVAITAICWTQPDGPVHAVDVTTPMRGRPVALYLALFVVTVLAVLRILPLASLIAVPAVLMVVNRSALRRVDYSLLGTFVAFFVFAGNVARMDSIDSKVTALLDGHVLIGSVLSSQFISNVPSAVLLAQFTADWRELLVGVNIGGVGTLVASLASLISLAQYQQWQPGDSKAYVWRFSVINFGLLAFLTPVMMLAFWLGLL